jgi:hypothetical protein
MMNSSSASVNPWILSYIEQNHTTKSRYNIDDHLLTSNYQAQEIEAAWQYFLFNYSSHSGKNTLKLHIRLSLPQLLGIFLRSGLSFLYLLGILDYSIFIPSYSFFNAEGISIFLLCLLLNLDRKASGKWIVFYVTLALIWPFVAFFVASAIHCIGNNGYCSFYW